jgi:HlyD family secretion protein
MRKTILLAALISCGLLASLALAQAPEKKETPPASPKAPETVKVEKGKFSIDVSVKGTLVSEETEEISIRLETWTAMTVAKAVPHGAKVKKGDMLVEFDLEKIDKALKDQEYDQQLAELAHKQAEEELKVSEKLYPLDWAAAKQAYEYSQEDLKKLMDSDLPVTRRNAEFMAKSSKNYLEYAMEELKQLEKMYRADDIKEETEEIILRRQRDTVEAAKNAVANAEKRSEDTIKYDLPRREQSGKESAQRAAINWEKAQITMPAAREQKKIAFEKARHERAKAQERFAQLKADRDKMAGVKAPSDGVVYYGKCTKGSWNSTTYEAKLQPKGGPISNDEVFMTIVKSNKLSVQGSIEEKDRPLVQTGAQAKVTPTALPERRLSATVQSIAPAPLGTSFDVKLTLADQPEGLLPGMTCQVKIKAYAKEDALTLPASAVSADEADEDQQVVYLPGKDKAPPAKKVVKVGKRSGDKVEIVEGLNEGDEVLKEKPKK